MRVSEKDVMQLLSVLDGTITDGEYQNDIIGGYSYTQRIDLWSRIIDQQSGELIDLEYGEKVVTL